MKNLVVLIVLLVGCSSADTPNSLQDNGTDVGSDVGVVDSAQLADMSVEPDVRPETCRRNADCWRGENCSGGRCGSVFGCKPATLPPPDVPEEPRGCWYEHGQDEPVTATIGGLGTARECETDADCANPDEPHCVVYVCHHNPSCSAGPCPAGTTCEPELDYCLDD